jgi:tRNA pseudouridine55 synthase
MVTIPDLGLELPELDYAAGQIILVDKPKGWTSFDAVNKIRGALKKSTGQKKLKVGHAGTLDPLATGLLIVATGKMTKRIDEFQAKEKEYEVEFWLGGITKTYDSEFDPEELKDVSNLEKSRLIEAMRKFTGVIAQIPPVYSALKIDGKRAYALARTNQSVDLKPRQVEISQFQLIEFIQAGAAGDFAKAKAVVVCSKGTYIRSLVHDVGQEIGVGAFIKELRRNRIGEFRV